MNLVVNGLDAMSEVEEPGQRDRALTIRTAGNDDGFVEVTVEDDGPGIAPDKLDDLFEPFFTTKIGGMGMGLSISQSIVEAHGGRIWATDNPGGGAVLHFTLPVTDQ